ncbi:hypothetical protein IC582_026131 [Cucumis melo]
MLSRFAPDVVRDEAARIEKFVRGLKLDLQGFVRAFKSTAHADALRLAVDMSLHERANLSKTVGRGSTLGQKRKAELQPTIAPQRNLRSGGLFQQHRQELTAAGNILRELPACRSCGRSHGGRCLAGSGVCFRCKQPGHTTDFYPQKLLETTSNNSHFLVGKSFCHYSSRGRASWYCGMDWLFANHASIDYSRKEVVFNPSLAASFKFKVARTVVLLKVISAMKASKLLNQGTWGILASVVDTREPEVSLSSEPVVREYPDVFPDELPELPTPRKIDFVIELEPDITPISRAPYRMALAELKELKV